MGSLHLYVAEEARENGYDRTAARNARRGLQLALATSRGELRGRDLRHAEWTWNYPQPRHPEDRLHPDRVAWRIGHHAGRAFAFAEIRYDAEQRVRARETIKWDAKREA